MPGPTLSHLLATHALTQTLYTALSGFDTNTWALIAAALHPDAVMEVHSSPSFPSRKDTTDAAIGAAGDEDGPPRISAGRAAIRANVFNAILGRLRTWHSVSNVVVRFPPEDPTEEPTEATLEALVVGQHCREEDALEGEGRKVMIAGRYVVDFVRGETGGEREEGEGGSEHEWKIKKWVVKMEWRAGDASVMVFEE